MAAIYEKFNNLLRKELGDSSKFEEQMKIHEEVERAFYANPLHWSNGKRRMHGLCPLRGKLNKYRKTEFKLRFSPYIMQALEEIIDLKMKEDWRYQGFATIEDIDFGKKPYEFSVNANKTISLEDE